MLGRRASRLAPPRPVVVRPARAALPCALAACTLRPRRAPSSRAPIAHFPPWAPPLHPRFTLAPIAPHLARPRHPLAVRTTRAALQVEYVENFACRGLPAGASRPRHGARQGCAPGAMSLSRRVLHPHIIRAARCLAAGPPGSRRYATPVRGLASRPPSPGSRFREHLTRPK